MSEIYTPFEFSQKISNYCRIKIFPRFEANDYDKIKSYLLDLIGGRKSLPLKNGHLDWPGISRACGVKREHLAEGRIAVRPALEAIQRTLPLLDRGENLNPAAAKAKAGRQKGARPVSTGAYRLTAGTSALPLRRPVERKKTGIPPKPVVEFPKALTDSWEDPASFHEALTLHVQRHGETYWHLHRAVVDADEKTDRKTIESWMKGTKIPRSVDSMEILSRIERRYQLPEGYFKGKLPNQSRASTGFSLDDISPAERRRMAWHLPDEFNFLPFDKQEEIVEWVRRVIISGATDYRRFQAAAMKQRYAIRFPGIIYGRSGGFGLGESDSDSETSGPPDVDPELFSGVVDAPPRLRMEMAELISFKTSTLTAFGLQRNGVWGEETASQKLEHLGLMLGALAASPNGEIRGLGIPHSHLTLALLAFPGVWDWYLQWRERRRGFYTSWEVDMLRIALALTREETGWLRQHGQLVHRVRPVAGLVSAEEIERAKTDWHRACDAFYKHATARVREIDRVARVHRDPFEPIMPILEAPSPVGEYRKITDEILRRIPDERRYPRAAAEAVRSFLLLRLGLHLGLRQKNLRQLMLCPRGQAPRTERQLEDMKRGELRWSERDSGWEVLIPAVAFKNSNSSYFGNKPFRLILPNVVDLYDQIEAYISRHRRVLLRGVADPGTFFVKTVKLTSGDASYDQNTFYEAWRLTIQRYGVYNPYTGRGAIKGLLPHGPHNVRDVLATHILKQTGSYEQASYAIQDTPDMVAQHYGRFLPQDKAALAAKILNQVWRDDG
ncbi:hypothetical protein J8I29_06675 [Labrys sp. LIt4]|uniref:hypothetical protein n=1 Tax=Labrys sp. LIt4 TaxID=2821355 RepID=UPI001AE072E4|nr:hypothetical protein [Labrys sp. LIt4]MBP0578982.1 hypothetical protein [Labrys sp. LIt4]